jgi:hypothetical protein
MAACSSPMRSGARIRPAALLLAIFILAGSFSTIAGLCIVPGPAHPEVGLDVCHPIQAPNLGAVIVVPLPTSTALKPVIYFQGSVAEPCPLRLASPVMAPDPPPPKSPAHLSTIV